MLISEPLAAHAEPINRPVSAKTLRQWSSPDVILAITSLDDEMTILPHTIAQARQSGARVLLVHVPDTLKPRRKDKPLYGSSPDQDQSSLSRMARQLRWLGIACEPLVLEGIPEIKVPSVAKSCGADRVIISFDPDHDVATRRERSLAERILPVMEQPVCVIGKRVGLSSATSPNGKDITLAVSMDSDCDVPLSFASRLAQEKRAKLTLLHVFQAKERNVLRTAAAVASKLSPVAWREAELFCNTEIAAREGDVAQQILKHKAGERLIVLCSPGDLGSGSKWASSVTYKVLSGARCPVIIVAKPSTRAHRSASEANSAGKERVSVDLLREEKVG